VKSLEEQRVALADTKKSTETIVAELKSLKLEYAELWEKHEEALETIEELSKTAAEEIDSRDAELVTLRAAAKEQHRWKKKVEVSSSLVDSSSLDPSPPPLRSSPMHTTRC
jgi:mevalonate kinase